MIEKEPYTIKEQIGLLTAFSKIFNLAVEPISEQEILKAETVFIQDVVDVCGVFIKSKRARILLKVFIEKENNIKVPNLNFKTDKEVKSYFSYEYLKNIIFCLEIGEAIKIQTGKDYPLLIGNKDIDIILAPRLCGEE